MGEIIGRILDWWFCRRRVVPAPTIVGAEYLRGYQERYAEFQAAFLAEMRKKPDAAHWKKQDIKQVAVFGSAWAQTAYDRVPVENRVVWWTIDEPEYPTTLQAGWRS